MTPREMLLAAHDLTERGFTILPIEPATKVPLIPGGCNAATTDTEQLKKWWAQFPTAGIGVSTAGLAVIDIDPGGQLDDDKLLQLAGAPTSMTPRGGRHIWTRDSAGTIRCSTSKLAPNVDVRGTGGYVVAPPTSSPRGKYEWVGEIPSINDLPEAPDWLRHSSEIIETVNAIAEGGRDDALTREAGRLRRVGWNENEIASALLAFNTARCKPPLSEKQVRKIAKSVSRYEPTEVPVEIAARIEPVLIDLADVERVKIKWLWPGHIPLGRITVMAGKPGEGKTFVSTDLVARVTTGRNWPDGHRNDVRGSSLMVVAEDGIGDTLAWRLDAHGVDPSHNSVKILKAVKMIDRNGKTSEHLFSLQNIDPLRQSLEMMPDCRLVVIDPIGSFLGTQIDSHRDNEVRSVLAPLAAIAEKHNVAVLLIAHTRKALAAAADDSVLGSRAFTGIARAVWHVSSDKDIRDRKLFLPGKNNLARQPDGLAFSIVGEPAKIQWESEPVKLHADDVMMEASAPGPEPREREAAEEWLTKLLSGGPIPAGDLDAPERGTVRGEAKAADFKWATVRRASEKLGVRKFRNHENGNYEWKLPSGKVVAQDVAQIAPTRNT